MLHDYPTTQDPLCNFSLLCIPYLCVFTCLQKPNSLFEEGATVQINSLFIFQKKKKNPSNYHSDFCTLSTVFDHFILNMFECQYVGTNCIFSQELHGTLLYRGNTVHLTSSLLRDTQVFHELLLCQQHFNGHLSA